VKKSFNEPPVQKTYVGYSLAIQLVRSAVSRFHRMEGAEGSDLVPNLDVPMIMMSNHQNGLMDPLISCMLAANHQIHWLTRADIFQKPFIRKLLFSFNQMPIFRQRDRLSDAKERNQRIFEICVDRLSIGATIGLFPEGNHQAMKTLRPLKRGVADMVALSLRRNPKMDNLVLLPVGIDYEQADALQRRLRYRVGTPIPFKDLFDSKSEEFDQKAFLTRIYSALDNLMVNLQPEERYPILIDFVRALRTTELTKREWEEALQLTRRFRSLKASDWKGIEEAHQKLSASGILDVARPEDLSLDEHSRRSSKWFTWLLAPLAFIGGLPSLPLAFMIQKESQKRVKEVTFMSTFKMSTSMFLFPIYWWIQSFAVALIVGAFSDGWSWTAMFGWYTYNLVGSRIAGFWYGLYLDWKGMVQARKIWNDPTSKQVWSNYVQAIRSVTSE
jgi:1-acyl-sn-glycerol-3-phosphate acyltransferase